MLTILEVEIVVMSHLFQLVEEMHLLHINERPKFTITQTAYDLCFGEYEIITTDNNSCKDTVTITIENPDTLKIESLTIDNACFDI